MDEFTLRHLDAWLDHVVRDEEREEVRAKMIDLIISDPSLVEIGWMHIYNSIQAQ